MRINSRYILRNRIGRGGMGEVYRATDRLAQKTVALKRLNIQMMTQYHGMGHFSTNDIALGLAHEFKTLASLRHPHIISVLDYGFDDERVPFFTMEYMPHLDNIFTRTAQYTDTQKVDTILQLLQGIHYLHRRGLLHRDVKPSNILMDTEHVKIIDFGLAIAMNSQAEASGTITYLAPELFQAEAPSIASDLYAVGLIAYEILAGTYPFDTKQHVKMLIEDILMTPPALEPIPEQLAPIIAKLLAKDPYQRYTSAEDVINDLKQLYPIPSLEHSIKIRDSFLQSNIFVGRQAELSALRTKMQSVAESGTAFYLIGGEAGVGKTRLISELRTHALVEGWQVWQGRSVDGGSLVLQLWRDIARHLVLNVDIDDEQASILKIIIPDIEDLIERTVSDYPSNSTSQRITSVSEVIVDLLAKMDTPLLLLLEDLHWLEESLRVIQYMIDQQNLLNQIMVVGTYRHDERPTLPEEIAGIETMMLNRLDNEALEQLTIAMLGNNIDHGTMVDFLVKESEGNTLFLIEVIRALADEAGSLENVTHRSLPNNVFTGNMQTLIQQRIQRVPDDYLDVLHLAALHGRSIDEQLLLQIIPSTSHIDEFIFHAELAAIINLENNQWQFTHDKIRDAVITSIPDDRKPMYHQRLAETIEALYADDSGYADMLYYHWRETDNFDKEVKYFTEVLYRFIIYPSPDRDVAALINDMLNRLPEHDLRRIRILKQSFEYLERRGDFQEAKKALLEAYDLLQDTNDQRLIADTLVSLGFIHYRLQEYEQANRFSRESLLHFADLDDTVGMGGALNNLGSIAMDMGHYKTALAYFKQCVVFGERENLTGTRLSGHLSLAVCATHIKDYELAEEHFEKGIAIAQEDKRLFALSEAYWNRAYMLLESGRDATHDFDRSIALAYELKAYHQVVEALPGKAIILARQGHAIFAAHLFGLAKNHPQFTLYANVRYEHYLPELEALLSPDALNDALRHGAQLDYDETLKLVLSKDYKSSTHSLG